MSKEISDTAKIEFKLVKPIQKDQFEYIQKNIEQLNNRFPEEWRDDFSGVSHSVKVRFEASDGKLNIVLGDGESSKTIPINLRESKSYSVHHYITNEPVFALQVAFELIKRSQAHVDFPESFKAEVLIDQVTFNTATQTSDEWVSTEEEVED